MRLMMVYKGYALTSITVVCILMRIRLCCCLLVLRLAKTALALINLHVSCDGAVVSISDMAKNLKVYMDSFLDFKYHVIKKMWFILW